MAIDIDNGLPNPENRTTLEHYTYWIRVEVAVGAGQQISVNGRSLTQADEAWITTRRKEYENKLASEAAKASGLPSGPVYLG
jgi:hypothetical protein